MIISDLEVLEVVSEETSILGAGAADDLLNQAVATATAGATAIGQFSSTATTTSTTTVAGVYSQSFSGSASVASTPRPPRRKKGH